MGCANSKIRKMKQKIADQDSKIGELLAEVEALKTAAIVDQRGPLEEIYPRVADQVVFKGNLPSDIHDFQKKLRT